MNLITTINDVGDFKKFENGNMICVDTTSVWIENNRTNTPNEYKDIIRIMHEYNGLYILRDRALIPYVGKSGTPLHRIDGHKHDKIQPLERILIFTANSTLFTVGCGINLEALAISSCIRKTNKNTPKKVNISPAEMEYVEAYKEFMFTCLKCTDLSNIIIDKTKSCITEHNCIELNIYNAVSDQYEKISIDENVPVNKFEKGTDIIEYSYSVAGDVIFWNADIITAEPKSRGNNAVYEYTQEHMKNAKILIVEHSEKYLNEIDAIDAEHAGNRFFEGCDDKTEIKKSLVREMFRKRLVKPVSFPTLLKGVSGIFGDYTYAAEDIKRISIIANKTLKDVIP